MTQIVNQFSFVLFVAAPLLLLALYLLLGGRRSRALQVASVVLLGLSVVGYVILRPGSGRAADVVGGELPAGDGRPVLVEVYSNY